MSKDFSSSDDEDVVKEQTKMEEAVDEAQPTTTKTYRERAIENGMNYTVTDVPPLGTSLLLGLQHYLTMLGATVLIPLIVCPAMGANGRQTAQVISSIFFVSGINTLLQTTIGDRLPIVQGGSFAYLPPTFQIIFNPELQAIEDPSERFEATIRTVQGAVIICGIIQFVIGYTGIITIFLKYLSPVTIAPVIVAIGLGLYGVAFNGVSACWSLGLMQLFTVILFSQYLKALSVCRIKIFGLFPVVLAIALTWSFGAILTAADVWDEGNACRTDANRDILTETPWIRIPYPFQWGMPIFRTYAWVPMLGGALASMIESVGDYYSCAALAGAPPPTPGIVSRGLGSEAIGVILSGLIGTTNATTSYSENIGAISITGVGSRVVVQCGACIIIVVSLIAKVGALFATMPNAMTSGLYCAVFGLIVAVGLSNLQYVDLNSPRNQFIIGFAIFNSMSIAGPGGYMTLQESNPFGTTNAAEIAYAIFSSPMIIAFLCAFPMDNTVAGTREERGLHIWDKVKPHDVNNDPEYLEVYALPICLAKIFRNCGYLEYPALGHLPAPPVNGYVASGADLGDLCCPCWFKRGDPATGVTEHDGVEGEDEKAT
ncbi:xanthine/uracil permease family protein [Nitzschia inconspicua]|uniref:Xanthine/uracil permease family protein n=1 Tax=Nitzschia inconspicua TaxID=303405 RepID=A0A9K3M1K0_9STRA|nr:xanthine/uracil permease family protein [Nitzschia inconspicua]